MFSVSSPARTDEKHIKIFARNNSASHTDNKARRKKEFKPRIPLNVNGGERMRSGGVRDDSRWILEEERREENVNHSSVMVGKLAKYHP